MPSKSFDLSSFVMSIQIQAKLLYLSYLVIFVTCTGSEIGQEKSVVIFDSGTSTLNIDIEDDDTVKIEESCVLSINKSKECAMHKDNDEVSFNWNEQQLNVFEDEGIIYDLSIVKNGNWQSNITIRVQVVIKHEHDEAQLGADYDLLKDLFIFDNETHNLSVPFEVHDGRIQAHPKHFYLMFHQDDSLSSAINEAKVFILNSITYRNQPENVTAELDGKVFFPCVRDTDGNGSVPAPHWQIKFSNSSIITTTSQRDLPLNHVSNETGLSVMVEDIELNITAYSNTGYLTIKFPYTTFYLRLYSTTHVRVGESISYSVIKTGGGDFTFNVTVSTTGVITHQDYFILNQSANLHIKNVTIPHSYILNTTMIINIIIAEPIQVIEEDANKLLISSIGEPLAITVYANVFVLDIFSEDMSVPVKKELQKICVRICLQDNSDDIDPSRNISLDIQLSQDSENVGFKLDVKNMTLNTGPGRNHTCFNVIFPDSTTINCGQPKMFIASIDWIQNPFEDYKVEFCQQEVTVTVTNNSCPQVATIIGVIFAIAVVSITVLIVLAACLMCCRKKSINRICSCPRNFHQSLPEDDHHRSIYTIN